MPFSFIIPAAASLIGASMAGDSAEAAAETTAGASREATALQQRIYEENIARQQPFLQTGTEFFNRLAALQRGGPETQQNFLQMDPGYGFRLGEGLKALERSAAARGGLMSGGTGKALQRYGQDLASQEYGAAYNRLANLANVGPQAAGVMSNLGQTYAERVGNIGMQQGETAANALLARGSAYQRGIGDIGQLAGRYYQQRGYTDPMVAGFMEQPAPAFGGGGEFTLPSTATWSDIRLKTNIERVGTRSDGLGVYEFDYIWGGPRQTGLMAQEVQKLYPDAVGERDGYLTVDYAKV